jgi:hypothetical protein
LPFKFNLQRYTAGYAVGKAQAEVGACKLMQLTA